MTVVSGRCSMSQVSGLRSMIARSALCPAAIDPIPSQASTRAASPARQSSAPIHARRRGVPARCRVVRFDRERHLLEDVPGSSPVGPAPDAEAGVEQSTKGDEVLVHVLAYSLGDEFALAPAEGHRHGEIDSELGEPFDLVGLDHRRVLHDPGDDGGTSLPR